MPAAAPPVPGLVRHRDRIFRPWVTQARIYRPCGTLGGNRLALWHPSAGSVLASWAASWATRPESRAPATKAYPFYSSDPL